MTIEDMAKIIEAEAGGLSYEGCLAVGNCIIDNNYNANAFTKPAITASIKSYKAATDSVKGIRRFPGYKILQFRSFKKYSNGNGAPDNSKIYSGICPMPKEYIYLGCDGKEPWGNMYYGIKEDQETIEHDYPLKLTVICDELVNMRIEPSMMDNIVTTTKKGYVYLIDEITPDKQWAKLKNGLYITTNPKYVQTFKGEMVNYPVKITIDDLNIRKGNGTEYDIVNVIAPGVYTIVEEMRGLRSQNGWGLLKSYQQYRDGWISLDYCTKI